MESILRKNIEREMRAKDISLAALSRASGVPYPTLQDLMKEKSTARISTVGAIAAGFGISPGKLLEEQTGVEPQPKPETREQLLIRLFEEALKLKDDSLPIALDAIRRLPKNLVSQSVSRGKDQD